MRAATGASGELHRRLRTYVINLAHDLERWNSVSGLFAPLDACELIRSSAVSGADIPRFARVRLAGSEAWGRKKGELGVFLSHVRTWEQIAESDGWCVVLEDDVRPLAFHRIASLEIPRDADLVFINDRMSPGGRHADTSAAPRCLPILEALRVLHKTGRGVGADGYLLTKEGALKLLDAVETDLCFGHLDWRLLRYSVSESHLEGELAGSRLAEIIRGHHNPRIPPKWNLLRAYCLSVPLVGHFATGSSRAAATGESVDTRSPRVAR